MLAHGFVTEHQRFFFFEGDIQPLRSYRDWLLRAESLNSARDDIVGVSVCPVPEITIDVCETTESLAECSSVDEVSS